MRTMKHFLALAAITATPVFAENVDGLVADLAGNNEHARVVARQLLPREGGAAVPKLLGLLRSDDANIWWAANAVLRDIFNELAVPGRGKEREEAANQLLALLAPAESTAVKERALKLLPIAAPAKIDLAPVAALLKDADLREKAREALGELGTPEAAEALAGAIDGADSEFLVALLNTNIHMRDAKLANAARPLLKSESPAVRTAAARSMAWMGQVNLLGAFRQVLANASTETQFDAADAVLRLCDAVAKKGGNYESILPAYREVFATVSLPAIQAAALVGLGTYGDETVVPEIIAAASGANAADLQGPALLALDQQRGRAAANALLAAYSRADGEMKVLLVQLFGRKKDPIYLPALTEALATPDAALRSAALIGLRDNGQPEAAKALGDFAQHADDATKPAALDALQAITVGLVQAGKGEDAGRAYLALYQAATNDDQKKAALEGIKQFPVPESFAVLINDLDISQIANMPMRNLGGLHKALVEAKRDEEAKKAEALIFAALNTRENVSALIDYANTSGTAGFWAGKLGAVTKWQIVGPFPFSMKDGFVATNIGEPNVDTAAKYQGLGGEVAWQTRDGDPLNGLTDLSGPLGMQVNACAYALAKINVAAATDILVHCGSDDGIKIWINGNPVHENNIDRGFAVDSDQAPAKLNAGDNLVLVQITQGGGGWNFGVRLTTPDGKPLTFTQP